MLFEKRFLVPNLSLRGKPRPSPVSLLGPPCGSTTAFFRCGHDISIHMFIEMGASTSLCLLPIQSLFASRINISTTVRL